MGIYGFTHSSTVMVHLLYTTQEPQDVLHRVSLWGIQRRLNRVSYLTGENQRHSLVLHDFFGTGGQRQQG